MRDYIYLDNASTTPLDGRVLDAMTPYLTTYYGNANSVHGVGRQAVKGLDEARQTVADLIGANFNEVYFTSGGTESNNLAIRGSYFSRGDKNKLIVSAIEHPSVLQTAKYIESLGALLDCVSPNGNGILSVSDYLEKGLSDAFLVCMMSANNEIGTLQPVKELAKACKSYGATFFTDGVQAVGSCDINVKDLGVDMLSFSAHKFGGPKGVGVLYIKNGTKISPQIIGGHQERAKRGGTSNVAGAVGLATALKLSRENLDKKTKYLTELRNYFIDKVIKITGVATLNGDSELRLSGNANLTFSGIDGEALLYALDINGVCASLGSACSSGTIEPSYVLKEIGLTSEDAKSTVRFTLSSANTYDEIDRAIEIISNCVKSLKK